MMDAPPSRTSTPSPQMPDIDFSNEQLSRYSRHILLPEIDLEGQRRISQAKVAIIGAGGLGSPAAMYLAASGVGKLTIVDHDTVDLGNLQRQIAYKTSDIGHNKSRSTAAALTQLNPEIRIEAVTNYATPEILKELAGTHDILIDACDNFETRFAINSACHNQQTPLVSGAAIRFQGQVSVFPFDAATPCYRCLYEADSTETQETCADRGIFAPLTGIVGSIQAAEALKLLTRAGTPLTSRLLTIDALTMSIRPIQVKKDPKCPVCGDR